MSDSLVDCLQNDIIFGMYTPGYRLTEDQIMARFDVKRHAVRAAFNELKIRGLLVHKPNRGFEVIAFEPDEVDALYEVRIILETAAAQRTPLPASRSTLSKLTGIARAHQQACEKMDLRAVFALNNEFHQTAFACCENARLIELIEEHARVAQPIRVVKYDDSAHMQVIVAQHFDIIKALGGTSQSAYVQATRQHLPASAEAFRIRYENRFGQ
ncbi:MAG: GntR family transcriptional regulator [Granulosicoccus sp.]